MNHFKKIIVAISIIPITILCSTQNNIDTPSTYSKKTPLQESATKGDIRKFAKLLAIGANPDLRWTESIEYDPTKTLSAIFPSAAWCVNKPNVEEFLTQSTQVTCAGSIYYKTAEKMLNMLKIRRELISYMICSNHWNSLTPSERLKIITKDLPENELPSTLNSTTTEKSEAK